MRAAVKRLSLHSHLSRTTTASSTQPSEPTTPSTLYLTLTNETDFEQSRSHKALHHHHHLPKPRHSIHPPRWMTRLPTLQLQARKRHAKSKARAAQTFPTSVVPDTSSDSSATLYNLHHYLHPELKLTTTIYPPPASASKAMAPTLYSPAPASAHDAIVDQYLRPATPRSNSSPAPNGPPPLHRTLTSATSVPSPQPTPSSPPEAITTALQAPIDPQGTRVTKALRSHIEAVLAAQEDIGRAHLALEGIESSGDNDELEARAKGVEEIMAKLSQLAGTLKSYHEIGTPSLVFQGHGVPEVAIAGAGERPREVKVDKGRKKEDKAPPLLLTADPSLQIHMSPAEITPAARPW